MSTTSSERVLTSAGEVEDLADAENALSGTHRLESLDLQIPTLRDLNTVIFRFGNLAHLTHLRKVCVSTTEETDLGESEQTAWNELDAMLSVLPALAEVHVYSGPSWSDEPPYEHPLLREWMPVLARRGVLHIYYWAESLD